MQVDGQVQARLVSIDEDVEMRDVSFGGFRLASSVPVTPGDVHDVAALTAEGSRCVMRARVVTCLAPTSTDPFYVSGWAIADDAESQAGLAVVIDSVTATLQFDLD